MNHTGSDPFTPIIVVLIAIAVIINLLPWAFP